MKLKMLILSMLLAVSAAFAQTPQNHADANWPVNTSWVNGVAPGYRPQNGGGLILNIGPGESLCSGTATSYSGGALALTANSVNQVYVDGGTCVPTVSASGFPASGKPIAIVTTNWNSIVSIDDQRTVFSVQSSGGGSGASFTLNNLTSPTAINLTTLTFAGLAQISAGGTNQNVELTPIGTGITVSDAQTLQVGSNQNAVSLLQLFGNGASLSAAGINANIALSLNSKGTGAVNLNSGSSGVIANNAFKAPAYLTTSNCASSASPAVCSSAAAGRFVIAASATSVVVNTTAVTASSEIQITEDQSLGTALSVTCNAGITQPVVTARVAGTSFTVAISAGLATNPVCFSYAIIN